MKFIIPENYAFKNKLFGFMDYTTAIVNVFWAFFVIFVLYFIPFSLNSKISIFIILYFPLFLFSVVGFHNENILYVFSYLLKYIRNNRVYFYSKD